MSNYEWKCNRCETRASDAARAHVEMFAEHHMRVMHPLFVSVTARPQRRNRRTSRPADFQQMRAVRGAREAIRFERLLAAAGTSRAAPVVASSGEAPNE